MQTACQMHHLVYFPEFLFFSIFAKKHQAKKSLGAALQLKVSCSKIDFSFI